MAHPERIQAPLVVGYNALQPVEWKQPGGNSRSLEVCKPGRPFGLECTPASHAAARVEALSCHQISCANVHSLSFVALVTRDGRIARRFLRSHCTYNTSWQCQLHRQPQFCPLLCVLVWLLFSNLLSGTAQGAGGRRERLSSGHASPNHGRPYTRRVANWMDSCSSSAVVVCWRPSELLHGWAKRPSSHSLLVPTAPSSWIDNERPPSRI